VSRKRITAEWTVHIDGSSDVSIRRQLTDNHVSHRDPAIERRRTASVRELARRLKVHHNTRARPFRIGAASA
jgi:hypothetical protein